MFYIISTNFNSNMDIKMEGDFIKLYLNHKNINTASKTQRSSNNPCFGYYNKSIDPKLRTDINSIQNTFKDFLTPINNIHKAVLIV